MALKLKVPNDWHSFGGFDPMNKVFLTKEKWNGSSPTPLPNVGLKILDSKALNTSKFEDVQNKVLEMTLGNENYSEVGLYSNPEKKYFIIEAKTVKRSDGKIASQFDIYFQDPTPNSSLWMDLQMAVEKKEAAKHKGLLGLLFNDSKVNWTELN